VQKICGEAADQFNLSSRISLFVALLRQRHSSAGKLGDASTWLKAQNLKQKLSLTAFNIR
jgi:hypothetical protein